MADHSRKTMNWQAVECENVVRRDRLGEIVLAATFLTLLAGRFPVGGVFPGLDGVDVRFLGVGVTLFAFVIWVSSKRRIGREQGAKTSFFFLWFTAWVVFMGATAMWAQLGARVSLTLVDFIILWILTAISTVCFSRLPVASVNRIWLWSLVIAVVYLSAALLAGPGVQGRYSAFGGGPNVFGRVLATGLIGAIALIRMRKRLTYLMWIPILFGGIVLSGSRGALFATICALMVTFWKLGRSRRGAFFGAGLFAAFSLWVLWGYIPSGMRLFVTERFLVETYESKYDSGRGEILSQTWSIFKDHSLIGAGLDGYYALVGIYQGVEYPHNLLLAVLGEGGLIGGLLLIAVLISGARVGRSNHATLALAAATLYGVASLFSGDYYDSRYLWFFLAMAVYSPTSGSVEDQPQRQT